MADFAFKFLVCAACVTWAATFAFAQADASGDTTHSRGRKIDPPKSFREMVAKQRLERQKKEHEEMLERGEKALKLTEQLEASLVTSEQISALDRERLESLENLVEKIRKDLGGRDDGRDEIQASENSEDKPSTVLEGFRFLKSTTVALVDELRKTTRFSISAAAIETSNNVLKLVRWLRLRG